MLLSLRSLVEATSGGAAYTLTGTAASIPVTGQSASALYNRVLLGSVSAVAITAKTASATYGRVLTGTVGSVPVTGKAASALFGRALTGTTASVPITGKSATLSYSAAPTAYTLTGLVRAIPITGKAATLTYVTAGLTPHGHPKRPQRAYSRRIVREDEPVTIEEAQDAFAVVAEAQPSVAAAIVAPYAKALPERPTEAQAARLVEWRQLVADAQAALRLVEIAHEIREAQRIAREIAEQEDEDDVEMLLLVA